MFAFTFEQLSLCESLTKPYSTQNLLLQNANGNTLQLVTSDNLNGILLLVITLFVIHNNTGQGLVHT